MHLMGEEEFSHTFLSSLWDTQHRDMQESLTMETVCVNSITNFTVEI